MTALAIAIVLVFPITVLLGLLELANRRERRRAEVTARQIALTDAIHAVVGPIVAPLVRRGRHGFVGVLPVRPGHPQIAVMVDIAQATLGPSAEIVLIEQQLAPTGPGRASAAPTLAARGNGGPRNGPPYPPRSSRPGGAVALG